MARIERYGEYRGEDWAIRMMGNALRDELVPYVSKKYLPYFGAVMELVACNPEEFRGRGYSLRDVRFTGHVRKGKKLVKVKAEFEDTEHPHREGRLEYKYPEAKRREGGCIRRDC